MSPLFKTEFISRLSLKGFKREIIDIDDPDIVIIEINGRMVQKIARGFGEYAYGYIFPIDTSDEEVARLSDLYHQERKEKGIFTDEEKTVD